MYPRQIAKKLLPPIVVDAVRCMKKRRRQKEALQQNIGGRIVPWSPGYEFYRSHLIIQVLRDESLVKRFRYGEPLPTGYGVGIDERCIEYPWLLTHLEMRMEVLLDAGSTLNYNFILENPALQDKVIHILTLAPEPKSFWQKGISYLFCDLRDIFIRDAYYDSVACLSTLEHVGCDNRLFTHSEVHNEHRPDDFVLAVQELTRVLKPGGTLFLTVPFGTYQYFGIQQIFDKELLSRAIAAFGEAKEIVQTFYRYTAEGWNIADVSHCTECRYVEWIARAWQFNKWPSPIPIEEDMAAAARAVACVKLVK
jgi:hypothetical protein